MTIKCFKWVAVAMFEEQQGCQCGRCRVGGRSGTDRNRRRIQGEVGSRIRMDHVWPCRHYEDSSGFFQKGGGALLGEY